MSDRDTTPVIQISRQRRKKCPMAPSSYHPPASPSTNCTQDGRTSPASSSTQEFPLSYTPLTSRSIKRSTNSTSPFCTRLVALGPTSASIASRMRTRISIMRPGWQGPSTPSTITCTGSWQRMAPLRTPLCWPRNEQTVKCDRHQPTALSRSLAEQRASHPLKGPAERQAAASINAGRNGSLGVLNRRRTVCGDRGPQAVSKYCCCVAESQSPEPLGLLSRWSPTDRVTGHQVLQTHAAVALHS